MSLFTWKPEVLPSQAVAMIFQLSNTSHAFPGPFAPENNKYKIKSFIDNKKLYFTIYLIIFEKTTI